MLRFGRAGPTVGRGQYSERIMTVTVAELSVLVLVGFNWSPLIGVQPAVSSIID